MNPEAVRSVSLRAGPGVMSEFTHLVDQARALSIFIGHVTDGPEIPTIVARSITIASLLALVGGAAFVMVVWWPVIDADPSAGEVAGPFVRRARRIGTLSWLGAVAGTAASLILLVRTEANEAGPSGLAAFTSRVESRPVVSTLLRLVLLALVGLAGAFRQALPEGFGRVRTCVGAGHLYNEREIP